MKYPWQGLGQERRPPVAFRERLKIALKVAPVVVGYFWFRSRTGAEPNMAGPALLITIGAVLMAISIVELLWLRGDSDASRIFTQTKKQAVVLQATAIIAGGTLLAIGLSKDG